eukprot:jgi/Psemu1/9541/gm1.9541_g
MVAQEHWLDPLGAQTEESDTLRLTTLSHDTTQAYHNEDYVHQRESRTKFPPCSNIKVSLVMDACQCHHHGNFVLNDLSQRLPRIVLKDHNLKNSTQKTTIMNSRSTSAQKNSKPSIASSIMIHFKLHSANHSYTDTDSSYKSAETEVAHKKLVTFSSHDTVHEVPNLIVDLSKREKKAMWYSDVELWTIQEDLKREVVRKRMKLIQQRLQKGKMPIKDPHRHQSHTSSYGHRRIRKKVTPDPEIPVYLEWQ